MLLPVKECPSVDLLLLNPRKERYKSDKSDEELIEELDRKIKGVDFNKTVPKVIYQKGPFIHKSSSAETIDRLGTLKEESNFEIDWKSLNAQWKHPDNNIKRKWYVNAYSLDQRKSFKNNWIKDLKRLKCDIEFFRWFELTGQIPNQKESLQMIINKWYTKNKGTIEATIPPLDEIVIPVQTEVITASPFKRESIHLDKEPINKDLNKIIVQNNYTNNLLHVVANQLKDTNRLGIPTKSTVAPTIETHPTIKIPEFSKEKFPQLKDKFDFTNELLAEQLKTKLSISKIHTEQTSNNIDKTIELHKLQNQLTSLNKTYEAILKDESIPDRESKLKIIEKASNECSDSINKIKPLVTLKTISANTPEVSRIMGNPRHPNKKNYYGRPTFPDVQFEEDIYLSYFSHDGTGISEWNIDGLAEGQIYKKTPRNRNCDFRWYKDMFIEKVLVREDCNKPFWKERFISGLPRLVCRKGLELCTDLKLKSLIKKDRLQSKAELGSFCQDFGYKTIAAPSKRVSKKNKHKSSDKPRRRHKRKEKKEGETSKKKRFKRKKNYGDKCWSCYSDSDNELINVAYDSDSSSSIENNCSCTGAICVCSQNSLRVISEDSIEVLFDIIEHIDDNDLKKKYLIELKNIMVKQKGNRPQIEPFDMKKVMDRFSVKTEEPTTVQHLQTELKSVKEELKDIKLRLNKIEMENITDKILSQVNKGKTINQEFLNEEEDGNDSDNTSKLNDSIIEESKDDSAALVKLTKVKAKSYHLPITLKVQDMTFNKLALLDSEIGDLLQKKIIRPSKSPWSCAAFYVNNNAEKERGAPRGQTENRPSLFTYVFPSLSVKVPRSAVFNVLNKMGEDDEDDELLSLSATVSTKKKMKRYWSEKTVINLSGKKDSLVDYPGCLELCTDLKLKSLIKKDRLQSKAELGSFCQDFGYKTIAAPSKRVSKKNKHKSSDKPRRRHKRKEKKEGETSKKKRFKRKKNYTTQN
ncbi:uncharacterized protein [Nicotiana sylvestris]|uniref:uncharacterized protein n=1 Tax=Nicotiana sylvestris TaxID=4096 RepID=UPI00388C4A34